MNFVYTRKDYIKPGTGNRCVVDDLPPGWSKYPTNYVARTAYGANCFARDMVSIGMAFDFEDGLLIPSYPSWAEYDVMYNGDERCYVGKRAAEYVCVLDERLRAHGAPEHMLGISVHKLDETNDGWHVTAQECQQALAMYDIWVSNAAIFSSWPNGAPPSFADDWLIFLRACAARDGFVTN